jgi:glycosyltransferase involved in cell wall biosynthesis
MDVLVFHGYLLRGTGSNVYNAELAMGLARLGHRVHLLAQEREPFELDWVDAVGTWDGGRLEVEERRSPARITVYRPPIGRVLPVYVADRYEGFDARPFQDLSDEELSHYVDRNVAAVEDVAARVQPGAALANHLVMGPVILNWAGLRYAVKIHGSALEYVVKDDPVRFLPFAREGLAGARTVLVGSRHTAESLWAALHDDGLPARTRLGPPGVDVHAFTPRAPDAAAAGVQSLVERLAAEGAPEEARADSFARDGSAAADALRDLDPREHRIVGYVGKLIVSKGVDLLLAAWPRVLAAHPDARLAIVGFGAYRWGLEELAAALAGGDGAALERIVQAGRSMEGGPRTELSYLRAFLDAHGHDADYRAAAARLPETVRFVGRLEHDELADLLPACDALVVPSTFPEAFGMVAVEGAACGALPVSADHSGLAEVTHVLGAAVREEVRPWLTFPLGDQTVERIASDLLGWLGAGPDLRAATRQGLVSVTRERYSWEGVARGVIAASAGHLDELPAP